MSTGTLNQGSEPEEIAGGWTTFSCKITTEASEVFKTAFKGFLGATHTPVAVATQVVSGINYRFFCNVKGSYPNAPNEAAIVDIYQPLKGHARIQVIKKIEDNLTVL